MAALDQLVATGSADKTVRLWSLGGEERRVLAGHKKRVGGTISPLLSGDTAYIPR